MPRKYFGFLRRIHIIEIMMSNKVHLDSQERESCDRNDTSNIITKVISGGQTGVDRAALDAALSLGCEIGGWCPKGRIAEDGVIPDRYPLIETPDVSYEQRTEWNVRDSDGTAILAPEPLRGGTAFTLDMAHAYRRPVFRVVPAVEVDARSFIEWILRNRVGTLNVAGPRESSGGGVYVQAFALLRALLRPLIRTRCHPDAAVLPGEEGKAKS